VGLGAFPFNSAQPQPQHGFQMGRRERYCLAAALTLQTYTWQDRAHRQARRNKACCCLHPPEKQRSKTQLSNTTIGLCPSALTAVPGNRQSSQVQLGPKLRQHRMEQMLVKVAADNMLGIRYIPAV
jgi:hypothetical protein